MFTELNSMEMKEINGGCICTAIANDYICEGTPVSRFKKLFTRFSAFKDACTAWFFASIICAKDSGGSI